MSMNEELCFDNQGLERSRQELQSRNEGLTALNRRLEKKIRELEDSNNDLGNLLASTDIAILFLDRHFHIRRYTPAATRLFRLTPSEIGRPMSDVTRRFDDDRLLEDARQVLAGIDVEQRELCAADGRWYLRRLLPYRTPYRPEDELVSGVVITFTEITDRKRAELALASSELRLRRIADAMPALISYIDTDERYRFINATYQRWFKCNADEFCGARVSDVVGAEAYRVIRPHLQRALGGEPVEYQAWIEYHDAGKRYVQAEYIPDQCADGGVAGVYVLVSDITERRRNEEYIERLHAENRARLAEMEALFEAAPIGIFVGRDADCRNMAMNRAGARMLRVADGVNPSMSGPDAPALPFRVFHDGRELTPDELPMQMAARRGQPINGFELELVFTDGAHRTLMTYAAPLRDADGGIQGCVGTFADITGAREADRRHRETLERLNLHLNNSPVAAMEWDADRHILRWSPAAERMFGWTEAEVLGQPIDALRCVHNDDCEAVHTAMAALLDGDVEHNRILNRNLRKDGEVIWCEWYNSVLRDADGVLVSVLSLAMDVTDRQNLEAERRLQSERLAEADRRKDEFLSMLGHELRNPLAPIRNALSVLAMVGDDKARIDWAHGLIDRQTGHLERLVDDLLDTARITRGAIALQTEAIDLRSVVSEAVEATEGVVAGRGHRLELELPEASAMVLGDVTRLVQVMTNLINNAAKYTDERGTIRVSLTHDDTTARLTVADNGRGIPAEDLPHIFDVFGQGRQAPDRADGGLGLGLPLVSKLVEMHGGAVDADSAGTGQGSRFIVSLPLSVDRVQAISEPPRAARPNKPKRIILADDNPAVLDSMKSFLQVLGHEVWDLSAGGSVPALVEEVRPDVVILDIGLPGIDGVEVARRLAKLPHRRAMKVVALSGYVKRSVDPELFDARLLKGASTDELMQFLD
jgi:PAS domain S-box-containing protein